LTTIISQQASFETTEAAERSAGRVVALLPRGETWRNFVYTGALKSLAEKTNLTLLSIVPNAQLWEQLSSQFDDVQELCDTNEPWLLRIQREFLDLAHGRWLWSEASKERWRLRDVEAVTASQKAKRIAKKAICKTFANQYGLRLLERSHLHTSRLFGTCDRYVKLYRRLQPSLVFNASHVHSRIATPAVEAARSLKIPTATFLFSWDNLTSQGRIVPAYDYYFVWNEAIRDQLLSLYPAVRNNQVFVTGTPQFDAHFQSENYWSRDEFCRRVGADPNRPMVLYTTGMANHMPGEPDIVAGIADMLKQMPEHGRPQLLLRVYPKDRSGRFDRLFSERSDIINCQAAWEPNWYTPLREDAGCLVNALRHSALGVNVASTVSLELMMFDKPVLNVGYNPPSVPTSELEYARYYKFDHYRPIVECGAVSVCYSPDEMATKLRRALSDPNQQMRERKQLIERFFGNTLDGGCGHRIAISLAQLSGSNSSR
jgi:hypothetical protein